MMVSVQIRKCLKDFCPRTCCYHTLVGSMYGNRLDTLHYLQCYSLAYRNVFLQPKYMLQIVFIDGL